MTTTPETISHVFDSMTNDERWLGFGYLGGRRSALDGSDPECPARPDLVADADRQILDYAVAHNWDREQLFEWANSKDGRWFADCAFGGSPAMAARYLR